MNYSENLSSKKDNLSLHQDYADFLKKALKRYTKSNLQRNSFLDWCDETHQNPFTPSMSANISNCSSWLKFRSYENNGNKLTNARFCKKDKVCPACAMRRASKQVKKVYNQLNSNPELLAGHWYYIVLPVRHDSTEDFTTVFDRLGSGLKSINQAIRNVSRGQQSNNFFAMFDGIMYSIEETKTENGWNIHANLLCRSDKPIRDLKRKKGSFWSPSMVETWKELTSSINVSINPIDIKNEEDLMKNLMEVFKYSLKFQDLSHEDLLTAYRHTYRRRLLGTMGSLRALKTDVSLNGDDIEDDLFIESRFTWIRDKYDFRGNQRGKVYKNGYTIYESDNYDEYEPPESEGAPAERGGG